METEKYDEAIKAFEELSGHKDSANKINVCKNAILDIRYNEAASLISAAKYNEAISAFEALGEYKDSKNRIDECNYAIATEYLNEGNKLDALINFRKCSNYKDSFSHIRTLISKSNASAIISAGGIHTVALKADGTVVAVSDNTFGQCDVSSFPALEINWN